MDEDLFTTGSKRSARRADTAGESGAVASPRVFAKLPGRFRRAGVIRAYGWATIFVTPLLLFVLIGLLLTRPTTTPVAVSSADGDGYRRNVAQVALDTWLAGDPAPLPGGHIVGFHASVPVDFTPVMESGQQANQPPAWVSTREVFDVIDARQLWWQVSVQVVCQPDDTCQTVGDPWPMPGLTPSSSGEAGVWPGLEANAKYDPPVSKAVQAWADAYVSGDSAKLALVVGDTDPAHVYQGIDAGVAAVTAQPGPAAASPTMADSLIVSVALKVSWPGSDTADNSWGVDVLVGRASTPAPVVVAWGPAGSGPTLTPFCNATPAQVDGVPTGAPPMPTPTPSQSEK